jgi:hypothetical protein
MTEKDLPKWNPSNRSSGQSGYFVTAVGFAVIQSIALFQHTQRDSGTPAAWAAIAWQVLSVAAAMTVLLIGLILLRQSAIRREEKLKARHPGAIVFPGVREKQLTHAFRSKKVLRADDSSEKFFPIGFSVLADRHGIEFWTGTTTLRQLFTAEWNDVRDVTVANVRGNGNSFRGICFLVNSNGSSIELPVVVTNRGPAGLLPERLENLTRLVESLKELRSAAIRE